MQTSCAYHPVGNIWLLWFLKTSSQRYCDLVLTNRSHYQSILSCPCSCKEKGSGVTSPNSCIGLAAEVWSDQWNHRVASIELMQMQEQWYRSKWCYKIHYSRWQICNPSLTRLQYYCNQVQRLKLVTTDPFSLRDLGGVLGVRLTRTNI